MKVKETKGITLIALVITIVVLLILAGVAIATLNGNDNIIKNANTAVGKYNEKANEEQSVLDTLEEKLKEYTNGGGSNPTAPEEPDTPPTTPTVDNNGLATTTTTIKPDENSNLQVKIPAGFAPVILEGSNSTASLPGESGKVKSIMPVEQWNNITTEQINKGIVVVDHAITYDGGQSSGTEPDFNEFVWIPITDTSKFARTAWTIGSNTTAQKLAKSSTSNAYWEDTTTSEYTQMVTSVTTNKGFYVARYEASADSESTKAQSKREATSWSSISLWDAKTNSANYNATLHSHLMYGIEWDSILNWLNGNAKISKDGQNTLMELSDLQKDSCSWGNYNNSIGNAATNSNSRQTTGKSEYWKANNIYDLAGNEWEWTQERWSTGDTWTVRGASWGNAGSDGPAAYRDYYKESVMRDSIGFRFSFYL